MLTLATVGSVLAAPSPNAGVSAPNSMIAQTGATVPSSTASMLDTIVDLRPHEAIYEMDLSRVTSSAGIVGAGGTIRFTFRETCDAWVVETHTDLTMLQTQGGPVKTSWDLQSWEAKDGQTYYFNVRNSRNGQLVESYEGEASRNQDGSGMATFYLPSDETVNFDLPKGTLFPVQHTLALLQTGMAGKPFLAKPVFDGSAVKSAFQVSATLGKGKAADKAALAATSRGKSEASKVDRSLLDTPAWPVTLAFYEPESDSPTPTFEVHLDYYASGATDALNQDFGTFSLAGTLTQLSALPEPSCSTSTQ